VSANPRTAFTGVPSGAVRDSGSAWNERKYKLAASRRASGAVTGTACHDNLTTDTRAAPISRPRRRRCRGSFAVESQFVAELPQWIDRWKDKASYYDDRVFLSPDEALALTEEVQAVVDRYRRERRDTDDAVIIHWSAFPRATRPEES
jgi:hypothetical protein